MTIVIEVTAIQYILAVISGVAVGFSLGLIGGGGSILAVPLLLYFVGLATVPPQYATNPTLARQYLDLVDHVALGTTALAVGLNAYINSYMHFRKGNVKLMEGIFFTIPGIVGAIVGGIVSHITPGQALLFFFGILMIAVALLMLRPQKQPQPGTSISRPISISIGKLKISDISIQKIIPAGFIVGFASGYFGIGGGFLIVPGLLFSTGLCMIKAVGTSLLSVGTFGITSAAVYAYYGYVLPLLSVAYLVGGIGGGYAGSAIASKMPRGLLRKIFAIIIIVTAIYIMFESYKGLFLIFH
ncbi:sulfite exporter TauE/SafE family protein [Acidianus sp. RZ1]|uniref:sulfite exporter TauE/SafE family protein n=1 Tax=Acidianus sp. RZ1 TaxID=1540082 RepID=UPI001492DBF0|nr:sulfite exporter TauE/SafE family protein [Acidianus sp. RZ1]NON63286.1 sulfite exporter TauE/SafE family protein [Acidianus sp. RZ1]